MFNTFIIVNMEEKKNLVELTKIKEALAFQNEEKEKRASELAIANKELKFQNKEKENRAAELIIANKELVFQNEEKEKRAAELIVANKELVFQNEEKEKRATELIIANKELVFQNKEKAKRAAELVIANEELSFQNEEKEKRATELIIANKELVFQNKEKANRAAELIIANEELSFQNEEKEKRATELIIANKELVFQNKEKANRAAELIVANRELSFQNEEKGKRAKELGIANKELVFQKGEKRKRAAELIIAQKELAYQNEEKKRRAEELIIANKLKLAEEKSRQSERIYKTIAASIPGSVICLIDSEYRYLLLEGDMLEKLGYSKKMLLGNKAQDVLIPELYEEAVKNFKRVFSDEAFTTDSRNGDYHTISKFVPLKDDDNKIYAAMIVVIDVSELKRAEDHIASLNLGLEQKITERTAQLEAANKELESFSYSVSHDLRAPLRAINGFTQILLEDYIGKIDGEAKTLMLDIIENSKKMGQLIDDLLEFSRIGKQGVSEVNIRTTEMVRLTIKELQQMDPQNRATVNVTALQDIRGDKNMFKQVFLNLISNALKYTGKKKNALIEIGSFKERDCYTYYVKDNGAGFDMLYYDKLFGVFQRLHSTNEFEGTGVGLAIVRRIITKHEGKVWAEGTVNEGACFYFSLPIKKTS